MHLHQLKLLPIIIGTMSMVNPINAQEKNLLIEEIKRGAPIVRIDPKFPIKAAMRGQEGWVTVSYVIGKDGNVNSAIVEDSSNGKVFNKATLKAINSWVYEPTTVNGKAIEQCKNKIRMNFIMPSEKPGARRKFVGRYKKIKSLIDDNDFETAKSSIDNLKKKGAWNLYEDAWLTSLEVEYYNKLGDESGEINALEQLSFSSQEYLDTNQTLNHLIRLFTLNVDRKLYVDALRVANKIKKVDTENQMYPKLKLTSDKIENFIATGSNYLVESNIGDEGVWRYDLARQSFGFNNDTKQLRKLDVRCENKHLTYAIEGNSVWTVPKSYGKCSIYVYGDQNAAVSLVEVTNNI
jgi:TonB family protein